MSSPDARTEMFRDLWLPPVDTVADLPANPEPDAVCFVREDGRAWIFVPSARPEDPAGAGAWVPMTPARGT